MHFLLHMILKQRVRGGVHRQCLEQLLQVGAKTAELINLLDKHQVVGGHTYALLDSPLQLEPLLLHVLDVLFEPLEWQLVLACPHKALLHVEQCVKLGLVLLQIGRHLLMIIHIVGHVGHVNAHVAMLRQESLSNIAYP